MGSTNPALSQVSSTTTLLTQYYHSTTTVLTQYYHSTNTVLPQYYHSTTTVLPQYYHSTTLSHSHHGRLHPADRYHHRSVLPSHLCVTDARLWLRPTHQHPPHPRIRRPRDDSRLLDRA